MRLAYLNLTTTNHNGRSHSILSKIDQQARTAKELGLPFDFYWLPGTTHPGDDRYTHLNILPVGGNTLPIVRWRQCRALKKLMRRYDRALLRHPLIDPVLFLCLKNRERMILEHHTKEKEELKVTGDIRLVFEITLGGSWIRSFHALTAVTPEIVDYEVHRSGFSGPTGFFPNSIDLDNQSAPRETADDRADTPLQIIMVSTYFTPWQGLDRILDQISTAGSLPPFDLHLVGRLSPELESRCKNFCQITLHGTLDSEQVWNLYRNMDLGVGSLTISRKGLTQATPLKVREYLAAGLPVVLGYHDPAIPQDFPYVLYQEQFDFAKMLEFAQTHRQTPGAAIREAARPHIDARAITQRLYDFCTTA